MIQSTALRKPAWKSAIVSALSSALAAPLIFWMLTIAQQRSAGPFVLYQILAAGGLVYGGVTGLDFASSASDRSSIKPTIWERAISGALVALVTGLIMTSLISWLVRNVTAGNDHFDVLALSAVCGLMLGWSFGWYLFSEYVSDFRRERNHL